MEQSANIKKNVILSIIIPSYNTYKYLPKYPDYYVDDRLREKIEVILIDDGSVDGKTPAALDNLCRSFPAFFRVIHKENGGHGSTINAGVFSANGKYLKVVDGDDWLEKEELIPFLGFLERCDSDVVAANYKKVYEGSGKTEALSYKKVPYQEELQFDVVCSMVDTIEFHSIVYNLAFLKSGYKPLDEHCFYVDTEFILYPIVRAQTISFYEGYLYNYLQGTAEQSVSIHGFFKNRKQLIRVLFSLLLFFQESQDSMSTSVKAFYLRRTRRIINLVYRILFKYPDREASLNELKSFNSDLKSTFPKQYSLCAFKFKLLRLFNFRLYNVFRRK